MRLTHSEPRSGSRWTDSGKSRERRELKHLAAGDTRNVPIHPRHLHLLRAHPDTFGTGSDGRVFVGPRGGIFAEWVYLDVYSAARRAAHRPDGSQVRGCQKDAAARADARRVRSPSADTQFGAPGPSRGRRDGHLMEQLVRG
jgi:hypothetical protein